MGIIAPIFDIRYRKVGTTVRDHKSAVTDDFPILLLVLENDILFMKISKWRGRRLFKPLYVGSCLSRYGQNKFAK